MADTIEMKRMEECSSEDSDDDSEKDDDNDDDCTDNDEDNNECKKEDNDGACNNGEDDDIFFGGLFDEDTPDGPANRSSTRSNRMRPPRPRTPSASIADDSHCCISLKKHIQEWINLYKKYYIIIRMAITSIIGLATDMGSDVWTTIAHYQRCNWWWGTYTAIFVILPCTWISYTLLMKEMWYHKDFKEKNKKIFLIICFIFQVLIFYWFIWKAQSWWTTIGERRGTGNPHGSMSKRVKNSLKNDISNFRKVKAKEGLLEGSLQLALQSYILLKKIRNYMEGECPDNCSENNECIYSGYNLTQIQNDTDKSFLIEETGLYIDNVQIFGIISSLIAVSYTQAFMYDEHRLVRKLLRLITYVILISIRVFIPAVLAVFGHKLLWFLAPCSSVICYTMLYCIRRTYKVKEYHLPAMFQMDNPKVLARQPKDVLYWGLNHMMFNVSSVSGLAFSIPYMICMLPFVVAVDYGNHFMYIYAVASGLSVICVIVNLVFVIFFRNRGKKIIALSYDT